MNIYAMMAKGMIANVNSHQVLLHGSRSRMKSGFLRIENRKISRDYPMITTSLSHKTGYVL